MSELDAEARYDDRVNFVVRTPEETSAAKDEMAGYGLSSHGLVVFDAEGEVGAHIDGHEFGRPEIEEAISKVMGR